MEYFTKKKFHLLRVSLIVHASLSAWSPVNAQNTQSGNEQNETICNCYALYQNWLPDAYLENASCACNMLQNDSLAKIIRTDLIHSLETTDSQFIANARQLKSRLINGEISRHKYRKFVKKEIVPLIYAHHKNAYLKAGCTQGPAPYWRWKYACLHTFKNTEKMFLLNVRYGGGCTSNKGGFN